MRVAVVTWIAILFSLITPVILAEPTHVAPVQPPSGKIFRFRLPFEPQTLDWTFGDTPILVTLNTMRGLYRVDASGDVVPDLADSSKSLEDGKVWRFKIREGIKWSDGVLLNAGHVTEGLRRLMSPSTASSYAHFLADVESVRTLGEREMEVRLKRPVPFLPAILSHWTTFPVRSDLILKYPDYGSNPAHMAFLGAFAVTDWQKGLRLLLKPNPHADPKPWFERVEAWIVADDLTALNLFDSGQLEFLTDPGSLNFKHPNAQAVASPILYFVGIGTEHPLARSPHGVLALSLALDRSQIPLALGAGHRPTTGICPPEMWERIGGEPAEGPTLPQGDAALARDELQKAGFTKEKPAPPLTLYYFERPAVRDLAQWVQAQWKKNLGITVNLEGLETKTYWSALTRRPVDFFINSKGASYPDPDTYFKLFMTGNPQNLGRWKDAEYDRLISEAGESFSHKERRKLYGQAKQRLLKVHPGLIPLFFKASQTFVKPFVQDLEINPLTGVDFSRAHYE